MVPAESSAQYRFGDLLALARQSWVHQMADRLAAVGYGDYRPSDAALVRILRSGPVPVGRLGAGLEVTRQAARKLVEGLERRGFANAERDRSDSRQLNVVLTPKGQEYADAVVEVIALLNRELWQRVDPAQLVAADTVLRASMGDDGVRERAARLVRPPGSHID